LERLKASKDERPLLAGKQDAELQGFIEHLLAEREPFYRRAAVIIQQNRSEADVLNELLQAVKDFGF
jgi:shikimate kinase